MVINVIQPRWFKMVDAAGNYTLSYWLYSVAHKTSPGYTGVTNNHFLGVPRPIPVDILVAI